MNSNPWSRTDLVDCLDLEASCARTWSFLWSGRVVIEPRTEGSAWLAPGGSAPLGVGTVLVAPAGAGHLRVSVPAGGALRVLFEHPSSSARPNGRLQLPQRLDAPEPAADPDRAFTNALDLLDRAGSISMCVSPCVSRAQRLIAETLADDLDLEEMSRRSGGLEHRYFCRLFQKAVGTPPCRYRMLARIARARELLAAGHDCAETAIDTGFCDHSHFTRSFREVTGTTPSTYIRACRSLRTKIAA